MPRDYHNIHGRRGGRGLRPWLLLPKVLAAGVLLGGIASAAAMWFSHSAARSWTPPTNPLDVFAMVPWVQAVRDQFRYIVVPATALALFLGVLLTLQHPRIFLRLRWLRVKLLSLALGMPALHLFMVWRLESLHHSLTRQRVDASAILQVSLGFIILGLGAVWIVFLGRLKPRLRQNWARDFPKETTDDNA